MSDTLAAFIGGAGLGWLLNEVLTRYQARLQRRLDELNERAGNVGMRGGSSD